HETLEGFARIDSVIALRARFHFETGLADIDQFWTRVRNHHTNGQQPGRNQICVERIIQKVLVGYRLSPDADAIYRSCFRVPGWRQARLRFDIERPSATNESNECRK